MRDTSSWFDRIGWRIALWLAVIAGVAVLLSP
jgi:hypothetical protein